MLGSVSPAALIRALGCYRCGKMRIVMKAKMFLLFASTLVVLEFAAGMSQSKRSKSNDMCLDIPSSPLKLECSSDSYFLRNYSTERIVKYRLGCVVQENLKYKVVDKRPYNDANLEPNRKKFLLVNSSHGFPEELCKAEAKLAVVEVLFADDGVWKAKE
jgi:hypothetical protein